MVAGAATAWLREAGLPDPERVEVVGARWRVSFAPRHGLPSIWLWAAPVGPVCGGDHAILGLRKAAECGIAVPPDARVLNRQGPVVFASTAYDGQTGLERLVAQEPEAVDHVMQAMASTLLKLRGVRFEAPAECVGGQSFLGGPFAEMGARARAIAAHLRSVGQDQGEQTDALVQVCDASPAPPYFTLVHGRLDPSALVFAPHGCVVDQWFWCHVGDPLEDWAAALVLQPARLTQLLDATQGWGDEAGLAGRLRGAAALFALTHPDHPASPELVRIALTPESIDAILDGRWSTEMPEADPLSALRQQLWVRLSQSPLLSGVRLDAWLAAAALWALATEADSPGTLVRLAHEQLVQSGGQPGVWSVASDVAHVEHPLQGLLDRVLDARAPKAAQVGARLLRACPLPGPASGRANGFLLALGDAANGSDAAHEQAVDSLQAMGCWGGTESVAPLIRDLERVSTLDSHQRWLPYVLWCLSRLEQQGKPLDPSVVQRLFGVLKV